MTVISEKYGGEELLMAAKSGDRSAREQLVVENSGLVWSVARRFFGRGVEPDDLYQLGCIGFLKAIDGYDPLRGTQFSTYAVPKIGGEIRRFLRDDGPIKVSRGLKEQALRIRRARERLCAQLGREPKVSELADATGLSAEEIAAAELAAEAPDSLQQENSDGLTLESGIGGEDMEERLVESVTLRDAIAQLDDREQLLIRLRFFKGLTQQRTAKVLGVSQVQVSRLEKKALEQLRRIIA